MALRPKYWGVDIGVYWILIDIRNDWILDGKDVENWRSVESLHRVEVRGFEGNIA
ncbi:MAG TPA: hypothetical protein VK957_16555 [Lunatimonas sp.]|nr:hypothetical protein [Lunatimonas sp.]